MDFFLITLISVAVMLAYAVPGYITVKVGAIKKESISAFAVILMYVCQPCLTIYSFNQVDYSLALFKDMSIFFGISLALQVAVIGIFYAIFHKKRENVAYRIANVAMAFGNVAFMGVPLLEALFPDKPQVTVFSIMFLLGMNLIGWTFGSAIITRDKKFISVKKAVFNPAMLALVVALPLFFTMTKLPKELATMFTLLGKMTTPLCMIIMGMRFATIKIKTLFNSPLQYLTVAFKQLVFPLLGMLIVWFLPLELYIKQTMVILCCTPIASVVLNFAELLGNGQETAANLVLLGTLGSIVTIPIIMLIITAIPI